MTTYHRPNRRRSESIAIVFDDGVRVIAVDQNGGIAFDGTRWLFDQCIALGYFVEFA